MSKHTEYFLIFFFGLWEWIDFSHFTNISVTANFIMLNGISGLLTALEYSEHNVNPYPAGISKWGQTKLSECQCYYNYGLTWR